MMKPDPAAMKEGAHEAVDAYGKTVAESLTNAVNYIREHPHRLGDCTCALKIEAAPAVVWQRIRDLSARCAKVDDLGPWVVGSAGADGDNDASFEPRHRD